MFEIRTKICYQKIIHCTLCTQYFNKAMKKTLLTLITLITIVTSLLAHDFYVSVTEVDFKNNSLQITMKVFINDLEEALKLQGKPKLNLGEPNENELSKEYIKQYLLPRFYLKVNDKLKPYKYVGQEVEDDAVWIYLEFSGIENIKSLEIMNSIITEKYDSQTNLIHTNINGVNKSLILNKMRTSDKLDY